MDQLTTAQVAASRGVSVKKVHRMIAAGTLRPAVKMPTRTGSYLFDPSEVERAFTTRPIRAGAAA